MESQRRGNGLKKGSLWLPESEKVSKMFGSFNYIVSLHR